MGSMSDFDDKTLAGFRDLIAGKLWDLDGEDARGRDGQAVVTATLTTPGDYVLRAQANVSLPATGTGGGRNGSWSPS